MKTYQDIEKELRELQDSWRHPTPDEPGHVPTPEPEGKIAALSVQFLLKELKREIGLRECAQAKKARATIVVEGAREAIRATIPSTEVHVANVPRPPAQEPEGPPVVWDIYMQATARIKELEGYIGEQLKPPVAPTDQEARDRAYRSGLETLNRWRDAELEWEAKIDRLQVEVERGKARRDVIREAAAGAAERSEAQIERLEARITSELEVAGDLGGELVLKDREISDMKEQVKVSTIAALAMFQKLKAAAVMAKSASAEQTAQYLLDSVNFHINGAMEVVNWLNGEQREEKDGDNERITDEAEPRGH